MKKTTFLIVGKHAVLEALKNPSRKIERVFLTEDAQKKLNRENQSLNLFKSISGHASNIPLVIRFSLIGIESYFSLLIP